MIRKCEEARMCRNQCWTHWQCKLAHRSTQRKHSSILKPNVWMLIYFIFCISTDSGQPHIIFESMASVHRLRCVIQIEVAHSCCSTVMRMWNYLWTTKKHDEKKERNRICLFVMVTLCTILAAPFTFWSICLYSFTDCCVLCLGILFSYPFMPLMINVFNSNTKNWKNNFLSVSIDKMLTEWLLMAFSFLLIPQIMLPDIKWTELLITVFINRTHRIATLKTINILLRQHFDDAKLSLK